MSPKQRNDNQFYDLSKNQHSISEVEAIVSHDKKNLQYSLTPDDELLTNHPDGSAILAPLLEHGERYHQAGKRDVELYIRTYNTLLRSSGEINLKALVQAHCNIDSSLHPDARSPDPDMSAFIYSVLRLPDSINRCNLVLLGQSEEVFQRQGYQVDQWQAVTSPARRRKWFYDDKETLAAYVASVSDTDDIVPTLVAFQIEWNKISYLLNADPTTMQLLETQVDQRSPVFAEISKVIRQRLHIAADDWERLEVIWDGQIWEKLHEIGQQRKNFKLRMLGGSHVGFVKATHKWWAPVNALLDTLAQPPTTEHSPATEQDSSNDTTHPSASPNANLLILKTPKGASGLTLREADRPVYIVSSNTHSLANLLSGFVLAHQDKLVKFAKSGTDPYLTNEYRKLHEGKVPGNWQNFLYFVSREWLRTPAGKEQVRSRIQEDQHRGIWHVGARHGLEIDAQIFELSKLRLNELDPRCRMPGTDQLTKSHAIILNIDYPLGMAAYRMLREILENLSQVRGIYILGKAATLNGSIGDVMISNVVMDEHSLNTYSIDNAFGVRDVQPYLIYGSVLDNQKAVSSKGTFLQNRQYLDFYYQANYTVVEMESGPYLHAIYEDEYLTRYPIQEHINFRRLPYELGILHYASDTPYTRGKNLGAGSLSYFGMDSTYACTVAMARRIFEQELEYIKRQATTRHEHTELQI
jgi:hypothetical protein